MSQGPADRLTSISRMRGDSKSWSGVTGIMLLSHAARIAHSLTEVRHNKAAITLLALHVESACNLYTTYIGLRLEARLPLHLPSGVRLQAANGLC
jgi:hypothetical protein